MRELEAFKTGKAGSEVLSTDITTPTKFAR